MRLKFNLFSVNESSKLSKLRKNYRHATNKVFEITYVTQEGIFHVSQKGKIHVNYAELHLHLLAHTHTLMPIEVVTAADRL